MRFNPRRQWARIRPEQRGLLPGAKHAFHVGTGLVQTDAERIGQLAGDPPRVDAVCHIVPDQSCGGIQEADIPADTLAHEEVIPDRRGTYAAGNRQAPIGIHS